MAPMQYQLVVRDKTAKHDTSPLAKAKEKATDLDDKAAGQLSSTD
jgi:hypothetical protein